MTAVIHHGPPGSYKTFSIIQNVLIEALQSGRLVITNIRGFNSIDRIKTALNIELPPKAEIWYIEPNDIGFKNMAVFFHWAPAGALIAMDEGQRIYPTRTRRFDEFDLTIEEVLLDNDGNPLINSETQQPICRPKTVENAFDQHRHFNWDIYISTPNISKVHKEIRHTVEWAYRHRNNSGLLPWMKNTWTEFRHDPENNGKSISHYSGSPKRYKAKPEYFNCYQSTATGTAKDSNENISIFRDSRLRFLFILIVLCFMYLGYSLYSAYQRVHAKGAGASASSSSSSPAPVPDLPGHVPGAVDRSKTPSQADLDSDPLKDAKVFFVGSVNNQLFFEVHLESVSTQVLQFNYDDFRHLGYAVKYKSSAFIALEHAGKTIYAFSKPNTPAPRAGEPAEPARVVPVGGFISTSTTQIERDL